MELYGIVGIGVLLTQDAGAINSFILGDKVLWLYRRWSIKLSGSGGCYGSEDVLFEETLLDELSRYFRRAQRWMVLCLLQS